MSLPPTSELPSSLAECHQQIADLRVLLGELQAALGAIRASKDGRWLVGGAVAEQLCRALLAESRDGVMILGEDGIVHDCNRALADLLGTTPERVAGSRLSAHAGDNAQGVLGGLLLRRGHGELELRAAGGRSVPIRLTLRELPIADAAGRPVLYGAAAELHTAPGGERLEAEARLSTEVVAPGGANARLRHAEKMEALGQLAGGVAHDFNNASAVVLAGLALLEKRHGAALAAAGPEVARLLAGLKDGAQRGASVARRLLSFARREELRAGDVDLIDLLGSLREVVGTSLGLGVHLRLEVPPGRPAVRADRQQLETTLINLAINARDAMPQGGTVVIGVATEHLSPEEARRWGLAGGSYVRLWVADTGIGMDAATLARATEPFFTTKPQDRGTGLGLAMADSFAVQSGGALRIESTAGRGTTAELWLPRVDATEAKGVEPGSAWPRRLALVVDDMPVMRRFLRECLSHAGWDAAEASGTREALALLKDGGRFDLLIADLLMPPGPDGIVLIREARAHRPDLPALLIFGSEGQPSLAQVAAQEGFAVLRKPVSPAELIECISALVPAAKATQSVGVTG
jgi:PAS domain S-box-containing protein